MDSEGNDVDCEGNCTYTHDGTDLASIATVTPTENPDGTLTLAIAGAGLTSTSLVLLKNEDLTLEATIDSTADDAVSATFEANPAGTYSLYVQIDDTYFAGFDDPV
jgi:hypothetical protein